MEKKSNNLRAVTVIGLGAMGSTIAKLFLDNNYQVTLWNRTKAKADKLIERGAVLAESLTSAINSSPVILVCVFDYQASDEIFNQENTDTVLNGKTIIQLTTGSPAEAKQSEGWFEKLNAHYLDGAIQVAPEQMAQADTTILLSGKEEVYQKVKDILSILGGNIVYLGNNIGLAATMDLATLSFVYGSIIGFFHGALLAEAEGFSVATYGLIVAGITPGIGSFLQHEATVIQNADFSISQSPLAISVEALKRIREASIKAGINTDFPVHASGLFNRAAKAGYANEELAAIIKLLRTEKPIIKST